MKLSVSLPDDDVAFLDQVAFDRSLDSRSAALQAAVRALREQSMVEAYFEAYLESRDESRAWDAVTGDGLGG
jgi:Arc/MetJ-type ribon-helix-helix transcriptional regulator